MQSQIFHITGNKAACFITDDSDMKFSSTKAYTVEEFTEAWSKKLTLATTFKIKYSSIKSINKEDNSNDVLIKYRALFSIPSEYEFSFVNKNDCDVFFTFLKQEQYFTSTHQKISAFRASRGYLLGFTMSVLFTIFSYYQAVAVANGTAIKSSSPKTQLYYSIIDKLGVTGVVLLGGAISAYLLYKLYTRFKNPPTVLKFIPPNNL